jgi:hypothetical protein
MTRKEIKALANILAECLDSHSNIEHRHGVLAAKEAIADMLYEDGHGAWSEFESAWREKMKIDA